MKQFEPLSEDSQKSRTTYFDLGPPLGTLMLFVAAAFAAY